jgi:hypothetical protein
MSVILAIDVQNNATVSLHIVVKYVTVRLMVHSGSEINFSVTQQVDKINQLASTICHNQGSLVSLDDVMNNTKVQHYLSGVMTEVVYKRISLFALRVFTTALINLQPVEQLCQSFCDDVLKLYINEV